MIAFWIALPFALAASTVVHECGHWLMAAALGCRPQVVSFGEGRRLGQVRAFGVRLVLRANPLGGYVLLIPMGRDRRDAFAAVTAAGPGANALALLAALLAWAALGEAIPGPAVFALAGAQGISLLGTLLPAANGRSPRPAASDGDMLLAWLRGRDGDMLALAYAPLVASLPPERRPTMTADFGEALFHAIRCDRDEPRGRREAMDGLRAVLARGRLNPCEHLAAQKRLQRDLEEQLDAMARGDVAAE